MTCLHPSVGQDTLLLAKHLYFLIILQSAFEAPKAPVPSRAQLVSNAHVPFLCVTLSCGQGLCVPYAGFPYACMC